MIQLVFFFWWTCFYSHLSLWFYINNFLKVINLLFFLSCRMIVWNENALKHIPKKLFSLNYVNCFCRVRAKMVRKTSCGLHRSLSQSRRNLQKQNPQTKNTLIYFFFLYNNFKNRIGFRECNHMIFFLLRDQEKITRFGFAGVTEGGVVNKVLLVRRAFDLFQVSIRVNSKSFLF